MIKNTIIITAENKENTINKTIQSCLNQTYKNLEIIIVYSKLRNEKILKKKIKSKKVIFFKIKKKIKNGIHDQLYKIQKCLDICNGKNIFLLDGDDIFNKKKVEILTKIVNFRKVMILDSFYVSINDKKFKKKHSNYNENYFYKKMINDWPKNICTSAITVEKDLLIKFFNEIDFKKYKYLAIDILLAIYLNKSGKLVKVDQFLTEKVEFDNSIDKNFIGYDNRFYWYRRLEQHYYNFSFGKKNYFSLDFLISFIISLFLKKLI